MPRCSFKNTNGNACDKKSDLLEYVLLYDPHQRVTNLKHGCHLHMTMIIDQLTQRQTGYENLMKACFKQIEKIDNELKHGLSVSEERQKIKDARESGLPEPQFKTTEELKNRKNELFKQIRNAKTILVKIRNKECCFCQFPLKEPEEPKDQLGMRYSNADFKGIQGHRRFDALFHTECFITWFSNKFALDEKEMRYIQPTRTGQHTIFTSMN